ncbi:hypothetical protein [Mammaliicoccus sciuri]|uniref:hypothetical protein n=1 Tax=Mammaliicoccus sciuri TaxID=1296 RepID=UPI003F552AE3
MENIKFYDFEKKTNNYFENKLYNVEPEISLVRDEKVKPYFIFSPTLRFMKIYNEKNYANYYTNQWCFKNVEFYKMEVNPLVTSNQRLSGFYSNIYKPYGEIINLVKDYLVLLGIEIESVYVQYPEFIEKLGKTFEENGFINAIPSNSEELKCNIPIPFNSYYMKFLLNYNNGLVPIINIVLIDNKNGKSMIDSAIFLERIFFVINKLNDSYESSLYKNSRKVFTNSFFKFDSKEELNICLSLSRAVSLLFHENIVPSSKGSGYTLKKLMKVLFEYIDNDNLNYKNIRDILYSSYLDLHISKKPFLIEWVEYMYEFYKNFKKIKSENSKKISKLLSNYNGEIEYNEFLKLKGTYGIEFKQMQSICEEFNCHMELNPKEVEYKSRILPYSYNRTKKFNPETWLENSRYNLNGGK